MELDLFALYAFSALGILVLLGTAYVARTHPRGAVAPALLLVLLSDTKFRRRDASAALTGAVDGQILFELGLYVVIATITAALLFATSPSRRAAPGRLERLLWGYVLVCIASCAWSVAPTVTVVRSCQVLVLLALVHASVRVVGSERIMRALTASSTFYVLSCAALAVLLPQLHAEREDGRFAWFYVHPISAGSYAAIAALCVLSIGMYSPRRWHDRLLWCPVWLFPFPLVAVLLLTGSRGPLLAFIGGTGILVLKRLRAQAATVVVSLSLLMMLIVVGSTVDLGSYLRQSDNVISNLLLRGQTADQVLGFSGRAELWKNTMDLFYEQPLIGYGYQASRLLLLDVAHWAGHAHNAYLQTVLDVGILGATFIFLAFALALASVSDLPGKRRRLAGWDEYALLATLAFLLLNSITDETFAVAGTQLVFGFACITAAAGRSLVDSLAAAPWRHPGLPAQSAAVGTIGPGGSRRQRL